LFSIENVKLQFTDDAIGFIAQTALDYELGARGLRSICEAIMNDLMFELPSRKDIKEFTITLEFARERISKAKIFALQANAA
jgi:ATP-dependent Clp protease ATP-binding subunit ClpX